MPKIADLKGNKRWRIVIDYRVLNDKTIEDASTAEYNRDIESTWQYQVFQYIWPRAQFSPNTDGREGRIKNCVLYAI